MESGTQLRVHVPNAPRQSAPVCPRRKQVAQQMRTCAETIEALFDRMDRDHNGKLSIDELRELMREVSNGSVDEEDVQFVMQHAQRGMDVDDDTIERGDIQQAISLWRYLQHERAFVAARFDDHDFDQNGRLDRKELKALMTSLNDGIECTDKEVAWLLKVGTSSTNSRAGLADSLDADEVKGALALWYPALRKRRQLDELPVARRSGTGKMRRDAAAQIIRHRSEVEELMQKYDCANGSLDRPMLHRLLNELNGTPVNAATVEYVLVLSDADHSDSIEPDEVVTAVAVWRTLHQHQDEIDKAFAKFDSDGSGKLSRDEVRIMLQRLNENLPVTWLEVDWLIESADANGDGLLDRHELRAAVAFWFLRVSARIIAPTSGWRAMMPWMLCSCLGLSCALLVASVSVRWSVVDTKAWLNTTLLSLMWKLVVFDPIKTLCCGSLLEPIYALICGEFEVDALLESVEDVAETYTEEFTGAQVGRQAGLDDVSSAAQAATVAAGNNSIFAMGGIGAGKFHRNLSLNRARRRIKLEVAQNTLDTAVVDGQQSLRHTLSNSRYADKVAAKRQAAGRTAANDFSVDSTHAVLAAHDQQMAHGAENENTRIALEMFQSARRDRLSVDEVLKEQAAISRRRYAGRVASRRRARMRTIGTFARKSGVHVDPLVDIMAVSRFIGLRHKASPAVVQEEDEEDEDEEEDLDSDSNGVDMENEVRRVEPAGAAAASVTATEEEMSQDGAEVNSSADSDRASVGSDLIVPFGEVPSARIMLPASILAATAASPQRRWTAGVANTMNGRYSARNVANMFATGVEGGLPTSSRPLPTPPVPARIVAVRALSSASHPAPAEPEPRSQPQPQLEPEPEPEPAAADDDELVDLEAASIAVWGEDLVEKHAEPGTGEHDANYPVAL